MFSLHPDRRGSRKIALHFIRANIGNVGGVFSQQTYDDVGRALVRLVSSTDCQTRQRLSCRNDRCRHGWCYSGHTQNITQHDHSSGQTAPIDIAQQQQQQRQQHQRAAAKTGPNAFTQQVGWPSSARLAEPGPASGISDPIEREQQRHRFQRTQKCGYGRLHVQSEQSGIRGPIGVRPAQT